MRLSFQANPEVRSLDRNTPLATGSTYEILQNKLKPIFALQQVAGILSWDQEVMMPPDGADQRAEQAAALESAIHQRKTDPALGDLLENLANAELDDAQKRNVMLARFS